MNSHSRRTVRWLTSFYIRIIWLKQSNDSYLIGRNFSVFVTLAAKYTIPNQTKLIKHYAKYLKYYDYICTSAVAIRRANRIYAAPYYV
jgi:hypothetical protein